MNYWRKFCYIWGVSVLAIASSGVAAQPRYDYARLQRERFGRGLVAVRTAPDTVMLSWRYLEGDPQEVAFAVYRNGRRLTGRKGAVSGATQFYDVNASADSARYEVVPFVGRHRMQGVLSGCYTLPAGAPTGYIGIPLTPPPEQVMPDGSRCAYTANDASVADLDGDGELEIILKWDPTNSRDNAHSGFTGTVFIDGYKLDGTRLWRIDLGRNIRAGAHYTQFMCYDLDGDGCAELVMKTADGTRDARGVVLGDPVADWRYRADEARRLAGVSPDGIAHLEGRYGYVAEGPEFLTVFSGRTGEALCSVDYTPRRGDIRAWGDNYANRSERYLAALAYLDGVRPSVVMCRGYYTRTVLAAYDWDGMQLRRRWVFDTDEPGNEGYYGQGNHNLRTGDVDGDGCDEIIYGSCAVDHDGKGLYTTGMGHGDALHLTAFDPSSEELQLWDCHENKRDGSDFRDAATGRILFRLPSGKDVGRCMAADIDPANYGVEMWSSASGGIRNIRGETVDDRPVGLPCNMAVWWDGDLLRELLDGCTVSKYDWGSHRCHTLVTFAGCVSNNGTKRNPCLAADIVGDWREEVLVRTDDSRELRLYVSPLPTPYRFHTFLGDPVYRWSVAMQNVGYNQPTQPGFYFGPDRERSGVTVRGYTFP